MHGATSTIRRAHLATLPTDDVDVDVATRRVRGARGDDAVRDAGRERGRRATGANLGRGKTPASRVSVDDDDDRGCARGRRGWTRDDDDRSEDERDVGEFERRDRRATAQGDEGLSAGGDAAAVVVVWTLSRVRREVRVR